MGNLMIVNGSPRAPRSNSKRYIRLFEEFWGSPAEVYQVTAGRHQEACRKISECRDLLLVFPLYVDGVPAVLMRLLFDLEGSFSANRPTVHVLVNCGFLEPEQNRTAVEIIRLFCKQSRCPFGSVLCIGAGEAILDTPFVFLVKRKIQKMVRAIRSGSPVSLKVTMPLTKKGFLKASTAYWIRYGAQNGIHREQMATMDIEGQDSPSSPKRGGS